MAGKKHTTQEQVELIIAMRSVGATKAVIANKVKLSLSTVSRVLYRHATTRGAVSIALMDKFRLELVESLSSNAEVKKAIALEIADDLEASRIIRDKIIEAVSNLPVDKAQAANSLRALNSAASALSTCQSVGRTTSRVDKDSVIVEEPTILTIDVMTSDDVKRMKAGHKSNDADYDD